MPIVTTEGKGYLTSLIKLAGRPGTEPNYIGMGTGATAEAAGDVGLVTEVETRANGTSSQVTGSVANDTYRVIGTITATATRAIQESGLFNQSAVSGDVCITRAVFTTINLASGDSIQFTWDIKLT